jgi:uncharacterized protein with GYD domain
MPQKYLVHAKYSAAGVGALLKAGGSSRKQAVQKMITDLGGHMEAFYYSINTDEAYVICDLPDLITGAAISLNVDSTGMVDINVTPLLTPEQVDEAAAKVVHYRAPGQ